jgi:hypothetical protein
MNAVREARKPNEIHGRLSNMYGKKKMLLLAVEIYIFGISPAAISANFTDDYCKNSATYW